VFSSIDGDHETPAARVSFCQASVPMQYELAGRKIAADQQKRSREVRENGFDTCRFHENKYQTVLTPP
jgi:hypothetical protein